MSMQQSLLNAVPLFANLKYWKGLVNLKTGSYSNGRLAIWLVSAEDGSMVAKATVNLPDQELSKGEVIIKDYSENEGMLKFLQDNKIVGETIRAIISQRVSFPVVKIIGHENGDW